MSTVKRKTRKDVSTTSPLILIGTFVSLTELVAGYTLVQTGGTVQMVLTAFVVIFPVLIAAAFFYLLITRNYVLFAPSEFGTNVDIKDYVETIEKHRNKDTAYDPAIHALMGILEAVRQNTPAIDKYSTGDNPVLPIQINIGAFPPTRHKSHSVRLVTTGSVTREEATKHFQFLAEDSGVDLVKEAIQQFIKTNRTIEVWIAPDGSVPAFYELDNPEQAANNYIPIIEKDRNWNREHIYAQIIYAVHDQLIVVYFQGELLSFSGSSQTLRFVAGMRSKSKYYSLSALVISDQGDIYGTMNDIMQTSVK